MTGGALGLAEEQRLAPELALGGLAGVELAEDVELGRGREVQEVLDLGHEMHLAAALQDVDALALGLDGVTVEVRRALLELREILDALHRPLRAEQPLDVHAPERRRVDAVAMLVRTDVADRVRGRVRVPVGVTVEAGHALVGGEGATVLGGVELRLGKRRDEEPQALELLGVEHVLEELVEVGQRHELALRHVTQVRPRGQVDRRRKLREQVLRQIEIEVEPREVAPGLALGLVDERLREHHAARFVMRVRQRIEARGPEISCS